MLLFLQIDREKKIQKDFCHFKQVLNYLEKFLWDQTRNFSIHLNLIYVHIYLEMCDNVFQTSVYWYSINLKLSLRKSILIILYHYSSNKLSIIVIYFCNYPSIYLPFPSISVLSIVWMESFSLYIHIFSKSYGALKIPKMACSKHFFFQFRLFFPPFINLLQGRYLILRNIQEIFILIYVAKSISFEVMSILKISTFAAKLMIL